MKNNRFKVGDKVKFICALNQVYGTLTVGKIYQIVGFDYDGDPKVINDRGGESSYMAYRFELIPDESSLDARIGKAKSLIGKTIKNEDNGIDPTYGNFG